MRLCERNLADIDIGLWPFPTVVPSVGVMLRVAAHVQAAQFGRIEELRALLDDTPELIDRANDRGMTALMAAAHGGHTAVVTMRRADVARRDDRWVSALEFAGGGLGNPRTRGAGSERGRPARGDGAAGGLRV